MLHDLDAGVLLQDVGDVGRDAALDVLLIDQLNLREGLDQPRFRPAAGDTMLSARPATSMTSRTGGTSPLCGTSISTRALSNNGIAASTS